MRSDVVVTQSSLPGYRETFFDLLAERVGSDFTLVLTSLERDEQRRGRTYLRVESEFRAPGRLVWWQAGAIKRAMSAGVLVVSLNPRNLSDVFSIVIRRAVGRPTLAWGHASSRSGDSSRRNVARRTLAKLASGVIAYSRAESDALAAIVDRDRVCVAPNAIYRRDEMGDRHMEPAHDFVMSSRLIDEKKPELAVLAFRAAIGELPSDSRLIVVGDGPLRTPTEQLATQIGVRERVEFVGSVFESQELSEIYGRAIASVSPGSVGLSIVQSFGFGVPMIFARNEPHGPEIDIAREGENAISVPSDDVEALADAMVQVYRNRGHWIECRSEIADRCKAEHSVEKMVDGFVAAIELARKNP